MRLTLEAMIASARSSTPAPQPRWQSISPPPLTLASPRLQTLAFVTEEGRRVPSNRLAKNPAVFQNSIHSFLGQDRGVALAAAIGEEGAAPFRSVAWHEQIQAAVTAARGQSPGTGHWLFLSLFLATRPAPERVNNALGELLRSACCSTSNKTSRLSGNCW